MLELVEKKGSPALLKVIGVGGGGSNAVNRMIQAGLADVDFWITNTDVQALERSPQMNRLQIGKTVTRGLGAGGDPEVGRLSAEEDIDAIKQTIEGADMVFITAGMGGGTGTGAAPVIARVARELNVLTVAIVTKPFQFEGKKKMNRAMSGLEALADHVDTLIAIPNQKLLHIVEPGTSFDDALLMADEVLFQATRGISDLIMGHGIINLDFADVRTVMRNRGNALLGSGVATGPDRAVEAAQAAVSSPLLEEVSIEGAEALLVNIQGSTSMGFHEAAEAAQFIADRVGEDADVFWGAVVDPELEDELRVTLVATGFPTGSVVAQQRTEARREVPQAKPSAPTAPSYPEVATSPAMSPAASMSAPSGPAPEMAAPRNEASEVAEAPVPTTDETVVPAATAAPHDGSSPPRPQTPLSGNGRHGEVRDAEVGRPAEGSVPTNQETPPRGRTTMTGAPPKPVTGPLPSPTNGGDRAGAPSVPERARGGAPIPPSPSRAVLPGANGGTEPGRQPGTVAEPSGNPHAPRESAAPPARRAEPAPFWRQQSGPLGPKDLGLPEAGPAGWSQGQENGQGERRGQHRNPLDVPTYLRKPIMD